MSNNEGFDPSRPLTAREKEVISEVCKGKSNLDIGNTLGINEKTVKFHLTRIFKKEKVKSRSALIVKTTKTRGQKNDQNSKISKTR